MDRLGFIHEKFDIKILILFVLRRLPAPVSFEELSELVLMDEGFDYFDYTQCLSELEQAGHVEKTGEGYKATALGCNHGEAVETGIPYSVRSKAEAKAKPVIARMKRDALISTTHEPLRKGGFSVKLSLSDDMGKLITLSMLAPDEEKAIIMEKSFRAEAEDIYMKIIQMLLPE